MRREPALLFQPIRDQPDEIYSPSVRRVGHRVGTCVRPVIEKQRQADKARSDIAVLKAVWLAAGQPCGKRLAGEMLGLWLSSWERHNGELPKAQAKRLLCISAAQIDREMADQDGEEGGVLERRHGDDRGPPTLPQ